jgi:hypothetical protein
MRKAHERGAFLLDVAAELGKHRGDLGVGSMLTTAIREGI